MELTVVRQHDTTVMVVGPGGANADRVTSALEQARVKVVRVGSAAVACEKLASTMPQVVILVAPIAGPDRADLSERSDAVGAIVMEVPSELEGDAYEDLINDVITTAITRKMARDDIDPASGPPRSIGPASGDDLLDDGWDE